MKNLTVNSGNKPAKKHVSRKLKSSWRKHIDTTDVDNFLEEKRQDERIGVLEEKQNAELFQDDGKPDRPKATLRELRLKKLSQTPTSLLALQNTSNVKDPIGKRNKKLTKAKPPVVPAITPLLRKVRSTVKPVAAPKDLWEEDEKLPEELRSEWLGQEQLLHTMKHVGKPLVINHPRKMDTADKLAAEAKQFPKEGTSYNPAIDAYVELKNEVVAQEKEILKKKAHFDRVVTNMFTKMSAEEKSQIYMKEMSGEVDNADHNEEDEEDDEDTTAAVKLIKVKRRKRSSKTKKREHHKKLHEAKKLKEELAKLKEINRIDAISEEINEIDKKVEKKALKRASKAPATNDMPIDFIEPELLSGTLRTIQPLNNLIATGLPKVRKISILRHTRGELKRKMNRARKKVSYIRKSHKMDAE